MVCCLWLGTCTLRVNSANTCLSPLWIRCYKGMHRTIMNRPAWQSIALSESCFVFLVQCWTSCWYSVTSSWHIAPFLVTVRTLLVSKMSLYEIGTWSIRTWDCIWGGGANHTSYMFRGPDGALMCKRCQCRRHLKNKDNRAHQVSRITTICNGSS